MDISTRLRWGLVTLLLCSFVFAESQPTEYPGVGDPFADPAQHEFAEDEKEDKEFFHLGRFLMLGFDLGAAIFSGGLGTTTAPGVLFGGRLVYFFDKSIAFESRIHYSNHLNTISATTVLDTTMISAGAGFRYYFDTKSAPRAITIANPYLALGAGLYSRSEFNIGTSGATFPSSTNFGGNAGGGVEFLIYRKHIYLGLDIRYHLVFFSDEGAAPAGLQAGQRAGDYVTTAVTLTYNF